MASGLDAGKLNERAQTAGVAIVPGAGFFTGGRGQSAARLAFSFPSVADVREGAHRLSALVRATVEHL